MHQGPDQHINKLRVSEELELEGKVFHRYDNTHAGITANHTTVAADSGLTFLIQADAVTLTLVSAATPGITHKIMNDMDDGECLVTIDPDGAETITGIGTTGGAGLTMTNTKATAVRGDYVILIANGTGWYVQECRGTWVIAT